MANEMGSYDPSKPDSGWNLVLPSDETVLKGVQDFIVDSACDLQGLMEAGYRDLGLPALANRAAQSRRVAGCYIGPPSSLEAVVPPPPFVGGQCPIDYVVDFMYQRNGGPVVNSSNGSVRGPISGVEIRAPQPPFNNPRLVIVGTSTSGGEELYQMDTTSVGWSSFGITGVAPRFSSQQDNCGNVPYDDSAVYPDGVELPPPPSPGDVVRPGETRTVVVDIDGTPTPVSFEVGDVVFNPDVGVEFNLGGLDFTLAPSLSLSFSLFGGDGGGEDLKPLLEEIKECLTVDISGDITVENCARSSITESYGGEGLEGLESQNFAVLALVNAMLREQCPVDAEASGDLVSTVAGSGVAGVNDVVLVPLTSKSRLVRLEVEGLPSDLRIYKQAGEQVEAPFGFMCLSENDGSEVWNDQNRDVKTRKTVYAIGQGRGYNRSMRISLRRGLEWTLFSLEVP